MHRGFLSQIDLGLLVPVFALVIISLTTLFSISLQLFTAQLVYLLISIVIFLFVSHFNYTVLKHYALPFYIISIVFLTLILIVGIESRGAVRWFEIFGFRFQFSELAKPLLAVSLASFLADSRSRAAKTYFIAFALFVPIFILIFFQPDLGSALVYLGVLLLALFIYGLPGRIIAGGLILFLAALPLFWRFLHDYQKDRIFTFLYPTSDPLGSSYNAIQAQIAVGSGSFFGKGLGSGTQSILRFLPERHTDFIFATISENLGLIGSLIIVVAFAFLFYRLYSMFSASQDKFIKMFTLISFFFIFLQFFINVSMNIGILPVVGITLPFVSYGGSSLLSNFIILGILSSYRLREREQVIAIR